MEYYLDYLSYWKYYVLLLYYWMAGYPPVVRICAGLTVLFFLLTLFLLLHNYNRVIRLRRAQKRADRFKAKYAERIKEIVTTPEMMSVAEIVAAMDLPKNLRVVRRRWVAMLMVFRELFVTLNDQGMNLDNWRNTLQAFKMPAFFEMELRSNKMKRKLDALKEVSEISCDLKEAAASRYLYAKDSALRMASRLHTARYSMTNPFKVFEEDCSMPFTDEMCVKLHEVLTYRKGYGMSMPNFIRWCTMPEASQGFRIFAINEIRLFRQYGACGELLDYLHSCRDDEVSCAIINTLGELNYTAAEKELIHRSVFATVKQRIALSEALGAINSGSEEVLGFLTEEYLKATDTVTKIRLLRVLYFYGEGGRKTFLSLKERASGYDQTLFSHIECQYIDSKKYA